MKKTTTILLGLALFLMGLQTSVLAVETMAGVVNVNTASTEQLMLLPGIGLSKAKLILEARAKKPFTKTEDLLEIKGIGEKMLETLKPYVAFDGKTTLIE